MEIQEMVKPIRLRDILFTILNEDALLCVIDKDGNNMLKSEEDISNWYVVDIDAVVMDNGDPSLVVTIQDNIEYHIIKRQ